MVDERDSSSRLLRFGPFELNLHTGELRKHGVRVRLPEQSCKVLVALLQHPRELVTREELQQRLWGSGTFVDFDHGLNLAVARLRQALGDDAEHPRYVETLPRKGYRFVTEVERVDPELPLIEVALNGHPPEATASAAPVRETDSRLVAQHWTMSALLIGAAVILGWWWAKHISHAPEFFAAVPLTSYVGAQLCPSFSPDGERVAFSWDGANADNYDIYVKQFGVERPVRLTTDPRPDLSPAWSPDGRNIAFLRFSFPGRAEVLSTRALAGGPEQHIATIAGTISAFQHFRFLTWSPDGRWLVVSDGRVGGSLGLFLLSVETGVKRRLTSPPAAYDDWDPAFSPDGTQLAFVRHSGDPGDVYVLELTKQLQPRGEPRRVTFDHRPISSPAWTRDGRALLSTRYALPGRHSLWKIRLSSPPALEPLPISTDDAGAVALAPSGHRLLYTRSSSNTNIWAFDLPAAEPARKVVAAPRLWSASSWENSTPSFSPDGQRVAFQSSRSGWDEIWLANRDGSDLQQVTELRGSVAGFPRWSPDGKRIVFHARQETYPSLFILEVAAGRVHRVPYPAVFEAMPSWSRDGKYIYCNSRRNGESQVWRMPADGGPTLTQVTTHGGWNPLESADGKCVFYTKPLSPGLWSMPVSGGEERRVFPDSVAAIGSAYTPTANGIYFIRDANSHANGTLMFYHFRDKRMVPLADLSHPAVLGLTVSPDERMLLYSQVDNVSSELMLVENFH